MLNKEMRKHVLRTLQAGMRYDGRGFEDYRDIVVETGVSKNAEGSARVRIGKTEVLAGVKMAIEKPFNDRPDEGVLMVNAELTPLSSPDFEAGPPGDDAIEIARVVDRGIREAKTVDLKALCVVPGEKVWGVLLDIVTVNDDGDLLDAAALAAVAALQDTRFPGLSEDNKVDYKNPTDTKLPIRHLPITVTVCKLGETLLVDPSLDEKESIDARLTIAVLEDETICAMQKGGEAPFSIKEIDTALKIAIRQSKELRRKVK